MVLKGQSGVMVDCFIGPSAVIGIYLGSQLIWPTQWDSGDFSAICTETDIPIEYEEGSNFPYNVVFAAEDLITQ